MKDIKTEYKNIQPIPEETEEIGRKIVDSAYRVHKKNRPWAQIAQASALVLQVHV